MRHLKKIVATAAAAAAAAIGMAHASIVVGETGFLAIDSQDGTFSSQGAFTVVAGPETVGNDGADLFGVNEGADGDILLFQTVRTLQAFVTSADGVRTNAGNQSRIRVRVPVADGFVLSDFVLLQSAFGIVSATVEQDSLGAFVQIVFDDMAVGMAGEVTTLFAGRFVFDEVAAIPLPAAAALFAPVLLGGAALRRRAG